VNRRLIVSASVLAALGAGLAVPALADSSASSAEEPTSICLRMPLQKPTDPKAPGYCIWIPGMAAAR